MNETRGRPFKDDIIGKGRKPRSSGPFITKLKYNIVDRILKVVMDAVTESAMDIMRNQT
jgi:hypothetical protein